MDQHSYCLINDNGFQCDGDWWVLQILRCHCRSIGTHEFSIVFSFFLGEIDLVLVQLYTS